MKGWLAQVNLLSFFGITGIDTFMLEKTGHIVLTDEDLKMYNSGLVSERIQELWGPIILEQLKELVETTTKDEAKNEL